MTCTENMSRTQLNSLLSDEGWSNAACGGYLILTCKQYGLSKRQTDEMLHILNALFDTRPVVYAEEVYMRY